MSYWGYTIDTLTGSGNISRLGHCSGLRVFANGVDGSFNINGGSTIVVRANSGIDLNPQGALIDPVVNWVSGTLDVFIETICES